MSLLGQQTLLASVSAVNDNSGRGMAGLSSGSDLLRKEARDLQSHFLISIHPESKGPEYKKRLVLSTDGGHHFTISH